eukprot:276129-Chlamydomonas_euryale.AAC.1
MAEEGVRGGEGIDAWGGGGWVKKLAGAREAFAIHWRFTLQFTGSIWRKGNAALGEKGMQHLGKRERSTWRKGAETGAHTLTSNGMGGTCVHVHEHAHMHACSLGLVAMPMGG